MLEVQKRDDTKTSAGVESRWTISSNLFGCVNGKTRVVPVQARAFIFVCFGSCVAPTNWRTPEASLTIVLFNLI